MISYSQHNTLFDVRASPRYHKDRVTPSTVARELFEAQADRSLYTRANGFGPALCMLMKGEAAMWRLCRYTVPAAAVIPAFVAISVVSMASSVSVLACTEREYAGRGRGALCVSCSLSGASP